MREVEISLDVDLPPADREKIKQLGFALIKRKSILGGDMVWTIVGGLGATAISALAKITSDAIKKHPQASIEINGIKASGISPNAAEDILRKHFEGVLIGNKND